VTEPITKVSFNAIPTAVRAIEIAAELTGDTRTDTINRAVQLYAFVEKIRHDGGHLVVHNADGTANRLDLA